MITELKLLDDMDRMTYDFLWANLSGIDEEELDWRPHPEGNTVRWIVGHLIWYEEWCADAIDGVGRYVAEHWPSAVDVDGADAARRRFDEARDRYRGRLAALGEADLTREIDYFRQFPASLRGLAATHTLHLSGHQYQVRYIRGAFSRERGTDKAAFDPW